MRRICFYLCVMRVLVGSLRGESAESASSSFSYQTSLQPLTLEEVWQRVVDNYETVQSLYIEKHQARLNVRQTLAKLLPAVEASAALIYANPSKEVDASRLVPMSFKTGSVTVSQSLIDLRLRPAYLAARYAEEAVLYKTEFEVYEILYSASEAYLALLQSRELLGVSEHQIALAEQHYQIAKARYEKGEVPISDLLRSEERLHRAQRVFYDVLSDLHLYEEALSNFIGEDASCYHLLAPLYDACETATDLCELIEEAYGQRQDLKSLAASIEAARQGLRTLERTNWPRLDFLGQYTLASPETLAFRNNSWSAGLWLTLPLFDQGINRLNRRQAEAELAKQELLYARMKKDLKLSISTLYYQIASARANYALLESEKALAEENHTILSARYARGQTSDIDLMDALNGYIEAQASYANAHYNLVLLAIQLKKETGFFETILMEGFHYETATPLCVLIDGA